jgi:ATP-dependent Clp protease ATP-binding subunit ClpC
LEDQIAEEILKGDINEGDTLLADHTKDATELTIKIKKKRKSSKKKEEEEGSAE